MKTYKNNVIREFELSLLENFTSEQINMISNHLLIALKNYNLTPIDKELIVYDTTNNKLISNYAGNLALMGKSKNTIRAYTYELKRFIDFHGKYLTKVNQNDIKEYLASKLISGKSKGYANTVRNMISSFYKWAYDERIIDSNPCEHISAVKCSKKVKGSFTDIEIDIMRHSNMSLRDRAIFEVFLSSGVRISELCNLNISDIDFNTLRVLVRGGKGDKDRVTYINRVAKHHLTEYLKNRTDNCGILFLSHDNRADNYKNRITPSGVNYMLKSLGAKSKVNDVHAHKFRHTFATMLYNNGMDIHDIQRLLGHNDISTTLDYITSDDMNLGSSYMKHIS